MHVDSSEENQSQMISTSLEAAMIDVVVILPLNNDDDPCCDILYQYNSLRVTSRDGDFFS